MLRKRIDRRERAKYNKQRGYTWEAEKEAMDWVEALGEIEGAPGVAGAKESASSATCI